MVRDPTPGKEPEILPGVNCQCTEAVMLCVKALQGGKRALDLFEIYQHCICRYLYLTCRKTYDLANSWFSVYRTVIKEEKNTCGGGGNFLLGRSQWCSDF